MSETAEFPLPNDATEDERAQARTGIGRYTTIRAEQPHALVFDGRSIGQTGPVWHLQYTRLYALPSGFLVAAHDLREGIVVRHADAAEGLPGCFEQQSVREFIEDELRSRGLVGERHAAV